MKGLGSLKYILLRNFMHAIVFVIIIILTILSLLLLNYCYLYFSFGDSAPLEFPLNFHPIIAPVVYGSENKMAVHFTANFIFPKFLGVLPDL